MNRPPFAAPLRADFGAVRRRPSDVIVNAIIAKAHTLLDVAKPDEGALRTRGAMTPATTTQPGWAAEFALTSVADLVVGDVGMGPVTAARELFRRGLRLKFGRFNQITVPSIITAATGIGFIGEDQPIPVRRYLFQGPKLTPHKLPVAVAVSNEMWLTPNAEAYIRLAMTEGLAADLDPILFDTNPASAIRPASPV